MRLAAAATVLRLAGGLCTVLVAVLALRHLSPHDAAAFFVVTAVTRMLATLLTWGRENAVIGAVGQAKLGPVAQRALAWSVARAVLRGLAPQWLAVVGLGSLILVVAHHPRTHDWPLTEAGLVLVGTPALCLLRIGCRALLSTGRSIAGAALESAMGQILLLTLAAPAGLLTTGSALAGAQVVTMLTAAVSAVSLLALAGTRGPAAGRSEVAMALAFVRQHQRSMTWTNVAAGAQEQLDIVLLGLISAPVDVNAYALAKRVASPLPMVTSGIAAHFVPRLAAAHFHGGRQVGSSAYWQLLRRLLLPTLLLAAAFFVGVSLFENELSGGAPLFLASALLVGLGNVVDLACGPAGLFLQSTGRAADVSRLSVTSLVIQVIGIIPAAATWGAPGVAVVFALVVSTRNLVLLRWATRRG